MTESISPTRPGAKHRAALCACAALLFMFAVTSKLAWGTKSATFDEPLHLVSAWIQTHHLDFRDDPDSSPLWKYYVAVGTRDDDIQIDRTNPLWSGLLKDPENQYAFARLLYMQSNADDLISSARSRMILLGVALGGLIAWWAWRLAGPFAGTIALAAYSLDPNFLAHAPLIKNDAPTALAFLGLMAAIWLLGENASVRRIVFVCLLLGAALTTKFSGLLGFPILAVALLIRAFLPQPWIINGKNHATRLDRFRGGATIFAIALVAGYCLIWLSYAVRFAPVPNKDRFNMTAPLKLCAERESLAAHGWPTQVDPGQMQEWVSNWQPSFTVKTVKWLYKHALMPQSYLVGFLDVYAQSLSRPAFLNGEIRNGGWWYYFPLAIVYKTPLATIAAILVAAASMLWWRRNDANSWPFYVAAVCPVIYMGMAMRSHLDLGIRYILPIYPFLFILIGVAAAHGWKRKPRLTGPLIAIFVLGLGIESFAACPNYIPFFNAAAGGSHGGLGKLSDSNIDWGQDLPALAKWQDDNPHRPLYFCYFGYADPRFYNIRYINAPGSYAPPDESPANLGIPPVLAISATSLQGTYLTPRDRVLYEPFRHARPIDVLGGAIYIFEAPPQWQQRLEQLK